MYKKINAKCPTFQNKVLFLEYFYNYYFLTNSTGDCATSLKQLYTVKCSN